MKPFPFDSMKKKGDVISHNILEDSNMLAFSEVMFSVLVFSEIQKKIECQMTITHNFNRVISFLWSNKTIYYIYKMKNNLCKDDYFPHKAWSSEQIPWVPTE